MQDLVPDDGHDAVGSEEDARAAGSASAEREGDVEEHEEVRGDDGFVVRVARATELFLETDAGRVGDPGSRVVPGRLLQV